MGPGITIEVSATTDAWYGAVVATAALVLSGWVAWRDWARIVVVGKTGFHVTPGGPYDPSLRSERVRKPRDVAHRQQPRMHGYHWAYRNWCACSRPARIAVLTCSSSFGFAAPVAGVSWIARSINAIYLPNAVYPGTLESDI